MNSTRPPRRVLRFMRNAALATGIAMLGACDSASDSLTPDVTPEDQPVVVSGQVAVLAGAATTDAASTSTDRGGIRVTFEGIGTTDSTSDDGRFRVEGLTQDGTVRIRFERGPLRGSVEIEGVTPGTMLRIDVNLSGNGASVARGGRGFEGYVQAYEVSGTEGARALMVRLVEEDDDDDDRDEYTVEIVEGETRFDDDGDIFAFGRLVEALDAGLEVEIEGYGELGEDGIFHARRIEAEVEDHDDDDHDEFDGYVTRYQVTGEASSRVLDVLLTDDDDDDEYRVRISEDATEFDDDGDIVTFGRLLEALDAGLEVEIDGYGPRSEEGVHAARTIEVDVEDDDADDDDDDDDDDA